MGRCFIKPTPESAHYVEWSSIVDSVVGYGTRDEILEHEREEHGRRGVEVASASLDRADQHGTSARIGTPVFGSWDDDELLVMEGGGPGYLKRADLEQYALLMCQNTSECEAQAAALLRPRVIDELGFEVVL